MEREAAPWGPGALLSHRLLVAVAGRFQNLESAAIPGPPLEGEPRHCVGFALPSQTHEDVRKGACRSAFLVKRHRRGEGNDGALGLMELHPQVAEEFKSHGMRIEIHRALQGFCRGRQVARGDLLLRLVNEARRSGPRKLVRLKQIFVAQPIPLRWGVYPFDT